MSVPLKNKLTVVIPCYNEENYIEDTLLSLYKQDGCDGLNVIIADGGSTDRTREIIDYYTKRMYPQLKIKLIEGGKVAYGRNEGSKYVHTKYVLFLDADSILESKNNLEYNVKLLEDHNLDLVTCKIKSRSRSSRSKIAFSLFNFVNKLHSLRAAFAVGGYFLTRTHKFRVYGKFDETLTNSEDYWLSRYYNPKKFRISKMYYSQDDRRFKKTGYLGMFTLLVSNFLNRNNIHHFKKDVGYW